MSAPAEGTPFPESLCHSCAAPPRYVVSDRGAVFIYCPVLARYPPQPVRACEAYRAAIATEKPTDT